MPIPLAMMMPFMAAQSMLMGDAFGKGFQFGKRKISAMSNEEFNALQMTAMVTDMQTEFKGLIPTLNQSIIDSKEVQNTIISEMIKIVPEFLKFLTLGTADTAAHLLKTHVGHDVIQPAPTQGPIQPAPIITSRREPTPTTVTTTTSGDIVGTTTANKITIKFASGFEATGGTTSFTKRTESWTLSEWIGALKGMRTKLTSGVSQSAQRLLLEQIRVISWVLHDQTGTWY